MMSDFYYSATHLSQARSGLAVIVLFCFVAVIGAKEAVADGEARAALQQGGAFVLIRHGTQQVVLRLPLILYAEISGNTAVAASVHRMETSKAQA